eukprot:2416402-Rhodomonas_salina.2
MPRHCESQGVGVEALAFSAERHSTRGKRRKEAPPRDKKRRFEAWLLACCCATGADHASVEDKTCMLPRLGPAY